MLPFQTSVASRVEWKILRGLINHNPVYKYILYLVCFGKEGNKQATHPIPVGLNQNVTAHQPCYRHRQLYKFWERFHLEMSNEEAYGHMQALINQSQNALVPQVFQTLSTHIVCGFVLSQRF